MKVQLTAMELVSSYYLLWSIFVVELITTVFKCELGNLIYLDHRKQHKITFFESRCSSIIDYIITSREMQTENKLILEKLNIKIKRQ